MGELSYLHISFLTFQATVQVIFICLAGYTCARCGWLNPVSQKNISLLNVNLFTPALIFSKLAPSLSLKKIVEISVIPVFYALSTGVSLLCSRVASSVLRLNEPESNFVTAMSVFGNSNSLPVSLTVALAYTLPNLSWDVLDDDSPDKIASRGILYLLIFQQLGQVLRWSWGYNTLLKKRTPRELAFDPYAKNVIDSESNSTSGDYYYDDIYRREGNPELHSNDSNSRSNNKSVVDPDTSATDSITRREEGEGAISIHHYRASEDNDESDRYTDDARRLEADSSENDPLLSNQHFLHNSSDDEYFYNDQRKLTFKENVQQKFQSFLKFMNPPLYAMALAVVVASIPPLQKAFYVNNGFTQNTLASAITELGSVSIPLILVVLGSNLYPNPETPKPSRNFKKIIFGSLISRMILPPLILLPLIALCVKYIEISILDDPIFLIVSFILTISPPAIQLSQICQLNELYEQEMAGVLFWGYVVLTLPTTITIVVASLEVLDWAGKLMK